MGHLKGISSGYFDILSMERIAFVLYFLTLFQSL